MMRAICVVMIGVSLCCYSGCGSKMVAVHGKVTLPDGKPAAGSQVVFQGGPENKRFTARGDVVADGTFKMGTEKPGDGVPPGKYNVLVNPPPMVNAEGPYVVPFNTKFADFKTSGLEFEVKSGAANDFAIQVTK
jgi:hypothetical protein